MKTFSSFCKTLTLILILLATSVSAWGSDSHFYLNGKTTKIENYYGQDSKYSIYVWMTTNSTFYLNNGSNNYGPNSNNTVINANTAGASGGYNSNKWKYTGATGLVRICVDQASNEWYPSIWVEEMGSILTGNDIMFYYGDTWGWGPKYLNKTKTNDYKNGNAGWLLSSTYCTVVRAAAGQKYWISNNDTWQGVQMSNNAAAGALYSLTNDNGNRINVTSGKIPEFSTTAYAITVGTATSGISATVNSLSSAGRENTLYYYYSTDGGNSWIGFDVNDVDELTEGEYQIAAIACDGFICVKSSNTATLTINPKTYSYTVTAGDGGTVSPASGTVVQGSGVTIEATPNDGYEFVEWTATNGTLADASSASTTFTPSANNANATASFKVAGCTQTPTTPTSLTAKVGGNELVGDVCSGTDVILTAGGTISVGSLQWGTGTVGDNIIDAENGRPSITVSPTVTTTYWVRSIITEAGVCYGATSSAKTLQINITPALVQPVLSKSTLTLEEGGSTGSITVTSGTTGGTWASSDPNVAIVDNGTVTPKGPGTATITYTVSNACEADKIATCDITVTAKPYYIGGRFQQKWNDGASTNNPFTYAGNGRYKLETGKTVAELSAQITESYGDKDQFFFIHTGKGKAGTNTYPFWTTKNEDGSGHNFEAHIGESNAIELGRQEINWGSINENRLMKFTDATDNSSDVVIWWEPSTNKLWYTATANLTTNLYLLGLGSSNWTVNDSRRFVKDEHDPTKAKVTITLAKGEYTKGTDDGFKIHDNVADKWYGNNGTMKRNSCTGWTFEDGNGNAGLTADVAGDYVFTLDLTTMKLTVTYPEAYKVTFSKGTGGKTVTAKVDGVAITSGDYVLKGKSVVFTQEANTGYTFSKWTDGSGNQLSTDPSYTCTVNADVTVKAVFVENKASIDITSSDDNKGTVSPTSAYVGVATKVEVTATPVDGYYTQTWTATAPAVSSATTGNTTTLSGNGTTDDDGTLVATFSERYQLISQHATNTLPGNNPYFTKQGDGSWACIVTLAANTEYSFKVKDYANNSAEYGNSVSALQSCADWVKIWKDANSAIKFKSTQAGSYTIHIRWSGADGISLTAPQVKITYPDLPTTPAVTYTAVRVYKEQTINEWIAAGDGAQATPYKFYNDETVRLTVTPLTEVAGLTAYYKVGETEQTANTFDLTNITTEVTPITITTYYKDSYGNKGPEATTTVYFQQVLTPELVLITNPATEISLGSIQDGNAITLSYSATYNGYSGSVTITQDQIIGNTTTTTTLTTTREDKYTYTYTNTSLNSPCIIAFTAQTTEQHGRIFKAHTEVAVYKNVTIKVNDPQGLMNKVYLWRDATDAENADIKTEWPGESFAQHFGTWRVFVVKYPYYTRFIVNDSKDFVQENGKQTENYDIPNDDACYELSNGRNGSGKYELTGANCPGDLAVGDIADITITQGENKIVAPSVQVSLGNKLSDVTAEVSSADATVATAIMSGTNIIVYGHEVGSTTITVDYTLHEETVTQEFQVTVEQDTHITIQVKVPIADGGTYDNIGWNNNSEIKIHYWYSSGYNADIALEFVYEESGKYKYLQAEVPLHTNGKTSFLVFYENMNDNWRKSPDVEDVSTDGCYTMKNEGYGNQPSISRSGDYCWEEADEYQVKIVMQNGKEYSSNIVTSTSDILSFFAPGKDEVNYRSGVVMLYKNDNLHTTIDPVTFPESNVYTAKLNADGTGLTNVAVYSGNFYIRTWGTDGDISNKGWNSIHDWTDSEKASRTFTEFVSREGEFYNHYWVQAMNSGGYDGKDVSACVANDYNDDLAGKLLQDKNTTEEGDIKLGDKGITINVRFGYDPRTNYFGRAVLQGSADASYLNLHCDNAYADKECTKKLPYGNHTNNINNKFRDVSNWVYERDVYVNITNGTPSASLYVEAKSPHVGKDGKAVVYNHLLGYVTNEITGEESETPIQKTVIGSGTDNGVYKVRVVYDFKTNRIIAVWEIATDLTITTDKTVNADILFIRKENGDVPQITLSGNGEINNLKSLFFAMELHRGSTNKDERHEEQYMFTLPFDCVVGSISGVHGYMELWGIQRYRGDLRAQKGWYAETATFWEWMSPKDTLKAGEGYLLAFDKKNATWNEIEVDKTDANGDVIEGQKEIISMLRLYFPSIGSGFDLQQQSTQQLTVTYPNHRCTLTLHNRYLQDSNWKMIGTTSYNNATVKEYDKDNDPEYKELTEAPSFRYQYSYTFDNNNNRTSYNYTPEDGKTATYKSFYGYMVQFAGTITWNPINETVPEPLAAPRRAQAERSSVTMRLELANTEGEKHDQTFVALDEDGTTTFDQNKDLNKVFNSGKPNIYTLSEGIPFAGNTLPMEEVIVPVGVQIAAEGEYTFRMPDGTEGMMVELVDYETSLRYNLLYAEPTFFLEKGTEENRFALHIQPQKDVVTGVGNVGDEAKGDKVKGIEKYLIDGKLIIRTAEGIFDAQGHRL